MIGKLKGLIDTVGEDFAIIDVNGVGYHVFASAQTLRSLPQEGGAASFVIETHVREDHIHLFGFATEHEREWFKLLLSVQGIGPRLGLAILSAISPQEIEIAVAAQDKKAFSGISGIGNKIAERIITELKSKIGKIITTADVKSFADTYHKTKNGTKSDNKAQDAISALTNLGYNRTDAFMLVSRMLKDKSDATVEEIIRESLKELAVS